MIPQLEEIKQLEKRIENLENKLNKTNIYNLFLERSYSPDLDNNKNIGIYNYQSSTLNNPHNQNNAYSSFGLVVTIGNHTDSNYEYYWCYQIAFGTDGKILTRQNINQGEWTSWILLTK